MSHTSSSDQQDLQKCLTALLITHKVIRQLGLRVIMHSVLLGTLFILEVTVFSVISINLNTLRGF